MTAVVRCGTLLAFLVLSVACGNSDRPTTPSPPQPTPPPPTPQPPPPLTGTYLFSGPLRYPVNDYTKISKFVLDDNGAFALRYDGFPRGLTGSYRYANGSIIFEFVDYRDGAIGTLNGDLLEVRYSFWMFFSDFEDAVYRRTE